MVLNKNEWKKEITFKHFVGENNLKMIYFNSLKKIKKTTPKEQKKNFSGETLSQKFNRIFHQIKENWKKGKSLKWNIKIEEYICASNGGLGKYCWRSNANSIIVIGNKIISKVEKLYKQF